MRGVAYVYARIYSSYGFSLGLPKNFYLCSTRFTRSLLVERFVAFTVTSSRLNSA